jgi:hypothetical protein
MLRSPSHADNNEGNALYRHSLEDWDRRTVELWVLACETVRSDDGYGMPTDTSLHPAPNLRNRIVRDQTIAALQRTSRFQDATSIR